MSIKKETYGAFNPSCTLSYKHTIGGINAEQTDIIKDVEAIMNDAFERAEEQIEYELYKKGFMTCNGYLENIDDMKLRGNELILAYINELETKYKE